jgi:hypothetical protein
METEPKARIAELRVKLSARIKGTKARPGYVKNVLAIRREIARLEQLEARHGQAKPAT